MTSKNKHSEFQPHDDTIGHNSVVEKAVHVSDHECVYLADKAKKALNEKGTESRLREAISPDKKDGKATDMGTWLKILGIVYGIASPFVVWIVVTIYSHSTELAILKIKQDSIVEQLNIISKVYTKIDDLNIAITKIQIDIATIKAKGNIP